MEPNDMFDEHDWRDDGKRYAEALESEEREDRTSIRRHAILLGLFLIAIGVSGMCSAPGRAQQYDFTPFDEVMMSRACVHEATWAGGERTNDCGAMLQVILERRRGREPFLTTLARTMPRFTAGITDRSWVLYLPPGPIPIGMEIPGWTAGPRPAAYSERWARVRARVHDFMAGVEGLPCEESPFHWFDPDEDGDAIAEHLATGRWAEAECGPVANTYLYRIHLD